MSRLVAGSVLVVVLATASAQAQERRPLSVVDAMQLAALGDPQLSPDGGQILFVLDAPD